MSQTLQTAAILIIRHVEVFAATPRQRSLPNRFFAAATQFARVSHIIIASLIRFASVSLRGIVLIEWHGYY